MILLSPAKTLDYDSEIPTAFEAVDLTRPTYVKEAQELVEVLRGFSASQVAGLMELSPALAELNVARFAAWRPRFTPANSRAAVLAFNGDVYEGLNARTLDAATLAWAQQHLRILSGLYGLLRPLDRLQPYRLEMGRSLRTERGGSLYAFWGDELALELNRLGKSPLVNLASQEYFKAVNRKALKRPVVEPVFEEVKGDQAKVISFFAKRARGLMARFALQNRLEDPTDLRAFADEGYRWQAKLSTPERWVFQRQAPV